MRRRAVIDSLEDEGPRLDAEESNLLYQGRMIEEIIKMRLIPQEAKRTDEREKVINWNDPDVLRYHAVQNRPFSKAKVRKNMCTYLKNQGGYKMSHIKGMSYEDIRPIFERVCDQNQAFVPKDSEIEKEVMKRPGFDLQQESSKKTRGSKKKTLARKRVGEKQSKEGAKRQKTEYEKEKEDLKAYLEMVPREEFAMEIESLDTKYPIVDWKTHILTRKLYIGCNGSTQTSRRKRLFDSCGIHILLMDNGIDSHDDREEVSTYSRNAIKDVKQKTRGIQGFLLIIVVRQQRFHVNRLQREMIASQLQGKLWLFDEVRTRLVDVDVERSDGLDIDPEIQAEINECIAYADALRARRVNARVVVEAVEREEIEARGLVEVRVDRVTHPVAIENVQKDQGHRIIATGQQSADMLERIHELELDNIRLRDMIDVARTLGARDAARNLEPLMGDRGRQKEVNGNRGNRNGNGNRNEGGNGYNFRGYVPDRECTYQDFLKCHPLSFNVTEGVVGLTRWFKKMETVFHISNCPEKYQVKYAMCTLLKNALNWWNSHKRTIRIEATYATSWAVLALKYGDLSGITFIIYSPVGLV
ncbi:hypothetical protein Tco_0583468 [Tanacetum coccineum]